MLVTRFNITRSTILRKVRGWRHIKIKNKRSSTKIIGFTHQPLSYFSWQLIWTCGRTFTPTKIACELPNNLWRNCGVNLLLLSIWSRKNKKNFSISAYTCWRVCWYSGGGFIDRWRRNDGGSSGRKVSGTISDDLNRARVNRSDIDCVW